MNRKFALLAALLLAAGASLTAVPAKAACAPAHAGLGQASSALIGSAPTGVVARDVNGDGILDLVTAISHTSHGNMPGEIAVRFGNGSGGVGNGTFGAPSLYQAGTSPFGLVAGDFTGDGVLDLVVTNISASVVSVLRGLTVGGVPSGAFSSPSVFAVGGIGPHHIVTADFNHDGALDVAVAMDVTSALSVLLGQTSGGVPTGMFASPALYPTASSGDGLTTADVNEDGILDILVTEYGNASIGVFIGNGSGGIGNGTFQPALHVGTGASPYDVAGKDIDGDGHVDLIVGRDSNGGLWKYHGNGDGTFTAGVQIASGGSMTPGIVTDFDGDGRPDIAFTTSTANRVTLLHGTGGGAFSTLAQRPVAGFPIFIASGDFNGDGAPDLAVSGYYSDSTSVLLSQCTVLPASFMVDRIRDVPNDLGGKVWVTWPQHLLDAPGAGAVANYRVWRRIPAALAAARPASALRMTLAAAGPVYWEAAAVVPAQRLQAYGYTASTAQDSLGGSNPYTAFFISAVSSTGAPMEDTPADSGYSVNNLAPVVSAPAQSTFALAGAAPATGSPSTTELAVDPVRDVPNDQGGKVWVTWPKSGQDGSGGFIGTYRVWRRIPAAPVPNAPVYWEAAAVLPAQNLPFYGYTAATSQDSLPGSNPYTAFFISAVTTAGVVNESTPVDSGYSVDNLPPNAPAQVQGQLAGSSAVLSWSANPERDLFGYRVHRGSDRFFVPGPGNLVGSPAGNGFTDPASGAGEFYKVAAVDVHGNVGPFVLVEPSAATSVEVGLINFDATSDGVTLTWYADAHAIPVAMLERAVAGGEWQAIASGSPDGGGQLVFRDDQVTMGVTYSYRLAWTTPDGDHRSPAVNVTIPGLALAMQGAWPNPAHGAQFAIRFTLTDDSAASLALYDVSGRRVVQREVGSLGAGSHVVDLKGARLAPGLYLARLSQHGDARTARVVLAP